VPATPVEVAFWASVSAEVDRRLSADPKRPVELSNSEWQSGNIIWLLDVVAAPKVGAALVKSIREKVGSDKTIKIRAVDADKRPMIKTLK
jgi:hemolysin-activating ACP:hemolysin acyltransferase